MASECYYLTVAEKDALLAANPTYKLVSGPHETEEECLFACESVSGTGGVVVPETPITLDCCPGVELPFSIALTFAIAGQVLTAQWNPTEQRYECDLTSLGCEGTMLYLVCQEQVWYLTGPVNVQGGILSCDPLHLTFSVDEICGFSSETITVTE